MAELLQKEWCGDAYVVCKGRIYRFEFISKNRLEQEASAAILEFGYYEIDKDTFVIDDFSYDEIIKTLAKLEASGYFDRAIN
ncbi:hypothetical protein ACFSOZ_08590 [Mesorhizobium newzealandense]|uniref:Phage protein n=1 Tax=Mesorhizobium newzealandense TaxID=1300302 RepID=A0ABW4U9H0_9HYPH